MSRSEPPPPPQNPYEEAMGDARRAVADLVNEKLGRNPFARAFVRIHKGIRAGNMDRDPQAFMQEAFNAVFDEMGKAAEREKQGK